MREMEEREKVRYSVQHSSSHQVSDGYILHIYFTNAARIKFIY